MRLTRKTDQVAVAEKPALGLNRRQFLKSAGLATGGIAAASMLGAGMMR
ncbi:twin-arginine translocation signal domain-containing protein, partial [Shewanella sairae]